MAALKLALNYSAKLSLQTTNADLRGGFILKVDGEKGTFKSRKSISSLQDIVVAAIGSQEILIPVIEFKSMWKDG